ncbi:MAG: 50S ribosomal protein L3 [Candidatus Portnoybacteria bacterium CG_4_8_14_3_um_filter_44_10]|uniref:Large ribosomal subunit protein uL3 n=4 Tax=Candidatus Portnoyibacteriota TaxID=1817913 RepID=A0A2H0KR74_9BACT|nr:MAG: 50S ribosomal protein L3 [Parcubacteria group bacterium CG2_30_44_18]PIQ74639.1 MAG: 50S ribosomal protein L3 [Candidatus Portnoybacteria bacterium CG11_big_fil_rev_8_21_14_0_20_44_10]PIW75148.1 MAG: 50S ribosomal protein L3 [Candidatus Portnoybacteria bacterium CG_4_8_14_3_um_filter_44_10]PIZ69813.1 MAG: 50S ribosomal protein L3 [Candidatus Portnoybacteria bacterium CG_4_10_14_0_2_um_filter_44_20]PJA63297.1 MAG: 50S ribosomal protein L3 [Candidatus Portnoybacteria bacterium CG_4_9_14_3
MAKFILAKKIGMTQIFDETGSVIPVTLVEAGPCYVAQIKIKEKDGYEAAQVGFWESKRLSKPQKGHLSRVKNLKYLREFKTGEKYEIGQEIKADIFQAGEPVKVSGISKGKGFAGVVKRYGFRGATASHGTKHALRQPGSIGSSYPERVRRGLKMAGRMGSERVTIKNLKIVNVDSENNIIAIGGAVPGRRGTLLEISGI